MHRKFKSSLIALALASISISASAISKEDISSIKGIATFTTGGVNLRKGLSTSEPYLIYHDGEELYFDAANIGWSDELGSMRVNGRMVQTDHSKLQEKKNDRYAVLGTEGEWVKLDYLGHEVWTMKKFIEISPLIPISTSMTYTPRKNNILSVTGTEYGAPALLYQEADGYEDQ